MKVYKKFCSLSGIALHHKTDAVYSDDAENSDHTMFKGVDPGKKSMGFRQYSSRDDVSHGRSADALSFIDPTSTFRDDGRAQIGKYSMRSAKSSHGDQFSVEMQGHFYDTEDNYAVSRSLQAGLSSAAAFQTPSVWKSREDKRRFGKYKLKPAEVSKIDFRNLDKKLKSVKPPKGRARRREANKEDNALIVELLIKNPTIWDKGALKRGRKQQ